MGNKLEVDGDCPMTRLTELIASKWALPVMYNLALADAPVRFGELKKSIGKITQRELSRTLKRFETMGAVNRKVFAEVPLRVEYSLTPLGRSLRDPILALGAWAEENAHKLEAAETARQAAS